MSLEHAATLDGNTNGGILINGSNSQSSLGFSSNEHLLNNFVTHLGLDGLPKGRVLHHAYLRTCPLMRIPRCEPVKEGMLRETRKWKMTDGPFTRWIHEDEMEGEHLHNTSNVFPDAHKHTISYTDDDYTRLLENEEWSRQETDRLAFLWNTFGGRFPIITDRYNHGLPDPSSFRPVEELKERLVEMLNKLNEARNIDMRLSYHKELDRTRRLQLEASQTRSVEQLREEVILTDVMAGMLPGLPEQMRQRDVCLSRLAQDEVTPSTSLAALPSSPTKRAKGEGVKRKKKPKKAVPVVEITENIAEVAVKSSHESRSGRSSRGEKKSPGIVTPLPPQKAAPPPQGPRVVLRSQTIEAVRSGLGRHVDRIFAEQGLPVRPVYPSFESITKYDNLRSLVVRWIDRQKELGLPSGSSLPASTASSHASSASTLDLAHPKPVNKRDRKPTASHASSSSNLSTSDIPVCTQCTSSLCSSKRRPMPQRKG